jgi:chromosome segregation ATPase
MDADSIDALLKCSFCSEPFVDPVISPDGNRSCRACVSSNDEHENVTPLEEAVLSDLLDGLRVKCIQCGEDNIRRDDIEKHNSTECSKRIITCTAVDLKCSWTGLYEGLHYHLKSCLFESLRPIFAEILAENIQFKEQIEQNRICYDKQQVEIEKLKERDYEQKNDHDKSSNENEQLKTQIEHYRIRDDDLQNGLKQLSEVTSQSNELEKVVQELKEQYNKLQTEIEQSKELYTRLINQNNDFRNNLDQLNEQINHNNDLQKEISQLKQQSTLYNELQTEFNQLKQSNNELQNKIQQLREQCDQQKIQYEVKQLSEYIRKCTTPTLQLNTQDQSQKDNIIQIKQLCNQHDIQIKLLARKKCVILGKSIK